LDILILLATSINGIRLKDIANELKIPVSSLHAILNTMKNKGFIERDDNSLLYRLSRKVYQITPPFSRSEEDLVYLALPIMDRVQHASGETVSLSVRDGGEIVFIAKRSSSSIIQVVQALGSRFPAHATGSGKVMLAYLAEKEIDEIYPDEKLPALTGNTITSKTKLKMELTKINTCGYAFDNEESVQEIWAVAACIHSQDGRSIAATSIVVPKFRLTEELETKCRELITEAAIEIGRRLGANSPYRD
jgi:DNA-binding IclR family transcriptional regulator